MESILQKILNARKITLSAGKRKESLQAVRSRAEMMPDDSAGFIESVSNPKEHMHIIAEVKKASPSKGIICENFDYLDIARKFEQGGASAVSVLTEENFFMGHAKFLEEISKEITVPTLRKDFIIDEYQIYEAKVLGASAFLLIVDCLEPSQLNEFIALGNELSLAALVEVHREDEIETALKSGAGLVGINNRDLRTFQTSLETTVRLRNYIPDGIPVVSESGIFSRKDITYLSKYRIQAVLVGESLTRDPDRIEDKLKELILPNRF